MSKVIDIGERRRAKSQPDADCTKRDEDGVDMFLFTLAYRFEDGNWSVEIWAYSMADAQARVDAMKQNLELRGQVHSIVPA